MSLPGFEIVPESMRESADRLDAATAEVQALLDQFTAALEEFADAFGGDTIGSLVGLAHQACTDALTECFSTNIEDLGGYARSLRAMADNHEAADGEIAQSFTQLQDGIGR